MMGSSDFGIRFRVDPDLPPNTVVMVQPPEYRIKAIDFKTGTVTFEEIKPPQVVAIWRNVGLLDESEHE